MAYTQKEKDKIFNKVCERIAKGESLIKILDGEGTFSRTIWFELIKDKDKNEQYQKAISSLKYKLNNSCKSNPAGSRANNMDDYRVINAKNINKLRFPNSSFYILQINNTDFYKLGCSQNISRRHRDIESSMPFVVNIIFVMKINRSYDFEHEVHQTYKDKYIKSEWFTLTELDIENIKNKVIKWHDL